jgi:hypothetical protein
MPEDIFSEAVLILFTASSFKVSILMNELSGTLKFLAATDKPSKMLLKLFDKFSSPLSTLCLAFFITFKYLTLVYC